MANPDTLGRFLDIVNNPANGNYQDPDYLVDNLFCAQDLTQNPPIPCVGITDHGPAFKGKAAVITLFKRLFTTFQNMQWTQVNVPLLATNEIGIQMTVTGTFNAPWFGNATGHVSPPLSQLGSPTGLPLGKYRGDSSGLPAFAVFTFNAHFLIRQLQIYLDRYALMQSITLANKPWNPDAPPYDAPHPGGLMGRTISTEQGRRITITIDD
jgi:hypothetical protein